MTQGSRVSAATVLTQLYRNILVSAAQGSSKTKCTDSWHQVRRLGFQFKQSFRWFCISMMTSWYNGSIFCVIGPLWGEFTGHWCIPFTKVSGAGFDVFFDLHLNKRLSKQSRHRWFETPSRSLWSQCNATAVTPVLTHWRYRSLVLSPRVDDTDFSWLTSTKCRGCGHVPLTSPQWPCNI